MSQLPLFSRAPAYIAAHLCRHIRHAAAIFAIDDAAPFAALMLISILSPYATPRRLIMRYYTLRHYYAIFRYAAAPCHAALLRAAATAYASAIRLLRCRLIYAAMPLTCHDVFVGCYRCYFTHAAISPRR